MRGLIKNIWLLLFIIFVIGLFTFIPFGRYQKAYVEQINRFRSVPQRRIDAAYRYTEAVENGYIDISSGIKVPKVFYIDAIINKPAPKPYSRPLYIRDKNNPQILYPFRGRYP